MNTEIISMLHKWSQKSDLFLLAAITFYPIVEGLNKITAFAPSYQKALLVLALVRVITSRNNPWKQLLPVGIISVAITFFTLGLIQIFHFGDKLLHWEFLLFLAAFLIAFYSESGRKLHHTLYLSSWVWVFTPFVGMMFFPENLYNIDGRFAFPVHANILAVSCAIFLPVIWEHQFCERWKKQFLTVAILLIILICKSRTAYGILVMILLYYTLRPWTKSFQPNKKLILLVMGLLTALLFIPSKRAVDNVMRNQSWSEIRSLTGRTTIWRMYLKKVDVSPWIGLGSESRVVKLWARGSRNYWQSAAGAHNLPLYYMVSVGIIGTIGIILLILVTTVTMIRRLRSPPIAGLSYPIRNMLLLGSCTICVQSLTESTTILPASASAWLFWVAVASAIRKESNLFDAELVEKTILSVDLRQNQDKIA